MRTKRDNSCFHFKLAWGGLFFLAVGLLAPWRVMALGSWATVAQSPPGNNGVGLMLLLPDGTVMAQQAGISSVWYRLAPVQGSYINGVWTTLACATSSARSASARSAAVRADAIMDRAPISAA